jgi:acetyltransferase-like isoleucine patch superfamily enzyme
MLKKKVKHILFKVLRNIIHDSALIEHAELISPTASIKNSQLSGNVIIEEHCRITGATISGTVKIGRWTVLAGPNIDVYSEIYPIEIGNFCSIARSVSIQEYNHNAKKISSFFMMRNFFREDLQSDITSNGGIYIGNDAWIGAQTIILSGSHISDGCVIGANSVVTGHLPPYSICVGSPARVIKYRFDLPIINKLLELNWWFWSEDKIRKNKKLFENELSQDTITNITNESH